MTVMMMEMKMTVSWEPCFLVVGSSISYKITRQLAFWVCWWTSVSPTKPNNLSDSSVWRLTTWAPTSPIVQALSTILLKLHNCSTRLVLQSHILWMRKLRHKRLSIYTRSYRFSMARLGSRQAEMAPGACSCSSPPLCTAEAPGPPSLCSVWRRSDHWRHKAACSTSFLLTPLVLSEYTKAHSSVWYRFT